jgi:hypothetical protein
MVAAYMKLINYTWFPSDKFGSLMTWVTVGISVPQITMYVQHTQFRHSFIFHYTKYDLSPGF